MLLAAFNPFGCTGPVGDLARQAGYNTQYCDEYTLASAIGLILYGVLSLLGVIFTALIVYGGYRWLTARGNETEVSAAKDIIRNAIIGLFIVLSSAAIWTTISLLWLS